MPEPVQLAWLAGFFDGEGSVHITGERYRHVLHVNITQTDKAPLLLIQEWFDGTVVLSNSHLRDRARRDCFRWQVQAALAETFLRAIEPYVVVKAAQVAVALELRRGQGPQNFGKRLDEDEVARRRALKDQMHDLHEKGLAQKERRRA